MEKTEEDAVLLENAKTGRLKMEHKTSFLLINQFKRCRENLPTSLLLMLGDEDKVFERFRRRERLIFAATHQRVPHGHAAV